MEDKNMTANSVPWSTHFRSQTPKEQSTREMNAIYSSRAASSVGFGTKLGLAFGGETVIGELWREINSPSYAATGYDPNDEDYEKYASDIPREAAERVAGSSESFAEFLYEVNEVRETNRRRQELFSGGITGMTTGLGLTLLAAGGEAVALTLLGGAVGTALGAGGTVAAGTATTVSKAQRIQAILKASGTAAAVDVPLELARYNLDKTLRPQDLIIALGASTTLSGALGAWKPHLFVKELQGMGRTAALREAAELAEKTADDVTAKALTEETKQSARVVPFDDDWDEVLGLSRARLKEEARSRNIATSVDDPKNVLTGKKARDTGDIQLDVVEARRKSRVQPEQVEQQILRDIDDMKTRPGAKERHARSLGISEKIIKKGGRNLTKAIVAARKFAAETGFVLQDLAPALPKLRATLRKQVSSGKVKIVLSTNLEKALWKIHTAKAAPALEDQFILINWLKKNGVKDPEALAKEFVTEARRRAKEAVEVEGSIVADMTTMKLKSASRMIKGRKFTPGEGESLFMRKRKYEQSVDPDIAPQAVAAKHPMEEPDAVVVSSDGKPLAAGPEEDLNGLNIEELGDTPEQLTVTGHTKGFRETLARLAEFGETNIPVIGPLLAVAFTPAAIRLLKMNSDLSRRFAQVFLERPRDGGNNVTTNVIVQRERAVAGVTNALDEAKTVAAKEGRKLEDRDIVRLLRSGEEATGAEGIVVEALRKFYKDMLTLGKEGGLFVGGIPESLTYFTRRWNTASFTRMVDKAGGGEKGKSAVIDFFTDAVLKHQRNIDAKLTRTNARRIASRIVGYGLDPEATRSWKGTQLHISKIKDQLIKEFTEDSAYLNKSAKNIESDVNDFIDAIIPHVDREPHLSIAKRRIDLDETYQGKINGEDVHIDDFMNNLILPNVSKYAQRVIGGVEVRKGLKAMFPDKDIIDFEGAKSALRASAKASGDDDKAIEFVETIFEHAYNNLTGSPAFWHPKLMKFALGSSAFAQATIGVTLGFAQIPEIASIVMRTGVQASLQQLNLGEVGKIFTMGIRDLAIGVKTGNWGQGLSTLRDDFSACLETFTGVGGDYRRGDHFMRRLDDMGVDDDYLAAGASKYFEYGRHMSSLNPLGIMPMDTFLRRWAVRSSFQHFVNEAYRIGPDGKASLSGGWWKNSKERFRQLGLDEDDITRLSKSLRDPNLINTEPGIFGKYTVKGLNLDAVEDQAIINKFALALRRHSDHMVQRQSLGETPFWVNRPVGKVIGQYRVFSLVSRSKQLAAGVARGDAHEAANVVGALGLGVLTYQAQSYYRSLGMSEKDRSVYLKEKFSSSNLIKAGVMKSSYAAYFPALLDTAASATTGQAIFDPSMRTTGLGLDPLTGSVPFSTYTKVKKGLGDLTEWGFQGKEMSQNDLRNFQSLIWAARMPGIQQTIDKLYINTAPK